LCVEEHPKWSGLYENDITATLQTLRETEGIDFHMNLLDTNTDGVLSRDEITNAIEHEREILPVDWLGPMMLHKWQPAYKHRQLLGALRGSHPGSGRLPTSRAELSAFKLEARSSDRTP